MLHTLNNYIATGLYKSNFKLECTLHLAIYSVYYLSLVKLHEEINGEL